MARRGPYNLDRTTKLLESHKQFPGGLKTVDSDDALGSFFLRDAENVSLSEYGFLERRYGLVDDANFELIVTGLQQGNLQEGFKDRLQGYFEYTLPNGVVETIVFVNGRLYLNGVQVKELYQYPRGTFADYGPSIDAEKFKDYVEETYDISFTTFDNIDQLFDTGRPVEATIINKKMYFFTGVYPLVYEGTGEFYLLPEYVPDFNDLFLAGHNLHTSDFDRIYNEGKPLPAFSPDMSEQTKPVFSELGYKPLLPYNINPPELTAGDPGRGLHLSLDFRLPADAIYDVDFEGYSRNQNPAEFVNSSGEIQYDKGLYLDFYPEVYTRPSGAPEDDRVWLLVEDENLEYTVLDNYKDNLTRVDWRFRSAYDGLITANSIGQAERLLETPIPPFIRFNRVSEAIRFKDYTGPYNIVVKNLPVGYHDYRVVFKIRKSGWRQTAISEVFSGQEVGELFFNEVVSEKEYVITRVFASDEKTDDFRRIRPEALWTCNRVLNHYGKLMAYGSLIETQRLFIGGPRAENREYFPFSFTRDFETDAAESIQSIVPFMNILTILTKTFTFGLAGTDAFIGSENLYRQFTISPLYGTIAPNTVRPVRNQLFFLSKEGIVSLQSLYAIDEQYNVKKIDFNVENIVPQDPEAVAIQYDDQYWIHFPNTPNNMTLRYDIDKRAWMKDTYFEWDGLDENSRPVLSETVFNGVHKYLREADRLILVTNPMQPGGRGNYSIRKLHVDYTIATDLWETPRTLFETSFLNQGYPFHEKKFMEKKYEFTIQNEYHLGKEALYIDRDMDMPGNQDIYTATDLPLAKNHEYQVNVPEARILGYNVRLFDIQGNEIKSLEFRENTPPPPSVFDFLVSENNVSFRVVNNDTVQNDIIFQFNDREDSPFFGAAQGVNVDVPRLVQVSGLPFGLNKLVLRARRSFQGTPSTSIARTIFFQIPDGEFDETGPTVPVIPDSLPPLNLSVQPVDTTANNQADSFTVTWQDQNLNPSSELFEVTHQNITLSGTIPFKVTPDPTTTSATISGLGNFQGNEFRILVRARRNGVFSTAAERIVTLELPTGVPNPVSVNSITQSFVANSRSLTVNWTDVANETQYKVFWKYARDDISPTIFENYYADQRRIIDANSTSFVFRTERELPGSFESRPPIFTNAVIDFNILPENQNGPATAVASRQAVVPFNYDPGNFTITPIDGETGIRIEIPDAKKQMTTRSGSQFIEVDEVFEDEWEIQFKETTQSTFPGGQSIFIETASLAEKNVIELKPPTFNFEPEKAYDFRLRPRHMVNGARFQSAQFVSLVTHAGVFNGGYGATFRATTGTATFPSANAPQINLGVVGITDFNFTLTNKDAETANLSYLISTSSSARVTESNRTGVINNVGSETTTANINIPNRTASTGYYITAGAKTANKDFTLVANIAIQFVLTEAAPGPGPGPGPEPTAPSAPSSVSISSPDDNQVSFNWPAVSGATSYNWQVLFEGSIIDSDSTTNQTSVTRSGIPAGQVQARVQACNANGCSAFTTSQFVTVSGFALG